MRLDVRKSAALTALVQVLAAAPKEIAKEIRGQSKAVIVPEFRKGLAERAPAAIFFTRIVNPSTVYVSDRGVKLLAGNNGGGPHGFPRETDFGAYREDYTTYTTRRGKTTRRTQRQFWHFVKGGRVFTPTISDLIPRIAALWTQTAYKTIADNAERAISRG